MVGKISHHCGSGGFQALHRDRLVKLFAIILDRTHQFLAIIYRRHPILVDNHRLDLFGTHDRANTAACRQT